MTQQVLFVALALVVAGAPAAAAQRERSMRFQDLDRNNDGRITRDEWRGNDRSFETHDWDGDGVLSGDEVRIGASRSGRVGDSDSGGAYGDWTAQDFRQLDVNGDGRLTRAEWRTDRAGGFRQADADGDGVITRREFLDFGAAGGENDGDDRFYALDVNRDNRISRDEWRDARAAFDRFDENRDGVLTRAEYSSAAVDDDAERFSILDVDRNGAITRGEWRGSAASFTRLDRNRDGRLSPQEYEVDNPRGVSADDDRLYRPQGQATVRTPATETRAYRAGYDRGLADGRNAGREDRQRNQGWDLDGQRELERADYGFSDTLGSRTDYQAGYRAAFRLGYGEGYGPR